MGRARLLIFALLKNEDKSSRNCHLIICQASVQRLKRWYFCRFFQTLTTWVSCFLPILRHFLVSSNLRGFKRTSTRWWRRIWPSRRKWSSGRTCASPPCGTTTSKTVASGKAVRRPLRKWLGESSYGLFPFKRAHVSMNHWIGKLWFCQLCLVTVIFSQLLWFVPGPLNHRHFRARRGSPGSKRTCSASASIPQSIQGRMWPPSKRPLSRRAVKAPMFCFVEKTQICWKRAFDSKSCKKKFYEQYMTWMVFLSKKVNGSESDDGGTD